MQQNATYIKNAKENSSSLPMNGLQNNTAFDDTRKRLASLNNNTDNKTNLMTNNNLPAYLKQITQDRVLKNTFQAVEIPEWKRQLIEKKKRQQEAN
jgi:hypothetical protein